MRRGVGRNLSANPDYENGAEPKRRPAAKNPPVAVKPAWLAKAGPNLALTAKVSVSGGSLLNDGKADVSDNSGRWLGKDKLPHEIEFAWEKPVTLGAARIISGFFDGAVTAPITDFTLQWHDGTEWRDISGAVVKGNRDPYWNCKFEPVTAKKLRLLVTKTKSDTSRIWEIEFYGPLASE
jgi:hypothetical protein